MKKILVLISSFIMLVCCSFVFTACEPNINEIEVLGLNTVYEVGEELDLTDVRLWVYYANGEEKSLDLENSMISGFDTSEEGEKTLVVTYKNKTFEIEYTVNPKTYSVNISLNNSEYGHLNIDNLKIGYEYGETINITVAPQLGYYLRGYSDSNSKSLTRTIVVEEDIDITVNLQRGEACNFYGYYLALENELNERTMQQKVGNTSSFIKFSPNRTFTSGSFRLECADINKFSCWVFKKEGDSSFKKVCSSRTTTTTLDEDELIELLGEKTDEWIDIYEYQTNVGVAYSVFNVDMDLDDGCFVNTAKFRTEDFSNSNLKYLYYDNETLKTSEFTTVSENTYTYSFEFDSTAFIQTFRIFEVDGELWYFTLNTVNYMLSNGQNRTFTTTINNVEYTFIFEYTSN